MMFNEKCLAYLHGLPQSNMVWELSDITLVYQPQSSSYSSILIQIYNVQHQHFTHWFIINIIWIKLIEGTRESFKDAY